MPPKKTKQTGGAARTRFRKRRVGFFIPPPSSTMTTTIIKKSVNSIRDLEREKSELYKKLSETKYITEKILQKMDTLRFYGDAPNDEKHPDQFCLRCTHVSNQDFFEDTDCFEEWKTYDKQHKSILSQIREIDNMIFNKTMEMIKVIQNYEPETGYALENILRNRDVDGSSRYFLETEYSTIIPPQNINKISLTTLSIFEHLYSNLKIIPDNVYNTITRGTETTPSYYISQIMDRFFF